MKTIAICFAIVLVACATGSARAEDKTLDGIRDMISRGELDAAKEAISRFSRSLSSAYSPEALSANDLMMNIDGTIMVRGKKAAEAERKERDRVKAEKAEAEREKRIPFLIATRKEPKEGNYTPPGPTLLTAPDGRERTPSDIFMNGNDYARDEPMPWHCFGHGMEGLLLYFFLGWVLPPIIILAVWAKSPGAGILLGALWFFLFVLHGQNLLFGIAVFIVLPFMILGGLCKGVAGMFK